LSARLNIALSVEQWSGKTTIAEYGVLSPTGYPVLLVLHTKKILFKS